MASFIAIVVENSDCGCGGRYGVQWYPEGDPDDVSTCQRRCARVDDMHHLQPLGIVADLQLVAIRTARVTLRIHQVPHMCAGVVLPRGVVCGTCKCLVWCGRVART